jgi:hypothetical protein
MLLTFVNHNKNRQFYRFLFVESCELYIFLPSTGRFGGPTALQK